MAFSVTVNKEKHFAVARVSGAVDVEELLQITRTLIEDPAWEPGFDILWDGRNITELVVSPQEMEAVADTSKRQIDRLGSGKTAIVTSREKDTDLAKMFTALAKDPRRERLVFSSLPDALRWLGQTSLE